MIVTSGHSCYRRRACGGAALRRVQRRTHERGRPAGARARGHPGRPGREPADRSFPARHRLARRRRTGRRRRRNRAGGSSARRSSAARASRRARCSIRISATEADASLREADANAAQLEARLGLGAGQPFDPVTVPDVLNAKASLDWAEAEFNRIKSLLDQKVVSQAEYDQRLTQVQAARQQYQTALNAAQQSYRSLQAARARVDLARKSSADTVVRAPFSGHRRRAPREHRRLRHPRHEGRHGGPDRSGPRGADRARAVPVARQGGPAGAADGRRLSRRGVHARRCASCRRRSRPTSAR